MEGQQERIGEIEPVGGQPSRNSGQTGLEPEEYRIDIFEISHRNWIESLRTAEESTRSQSQWPRIPKVPQMLRGTQDFKKFYEPRLISIGPYHHGKPHLHAGEIIKRLCARKFLADSEQDMDALYTKIQSNIEAVRTCYDMISTNKYDDEKLARMMLLDGCFLLQFFCGRAGNLRKKKSRRRVKEEMGGPVAHGRKAKNEAFRNTKELKVAGIHLQPSGTSFLRDVSFNSYFFYGCLNLPPIIVDDFTKPKFLNIVAYEMCPDAPDDYAVTSYVCFLYELIDHADDVKELRSKHILYNCLGSDEDVAKFSTRSAMAWSPWTIIAFIAAVLILLLTGFQTYFAFPAKSK
ncbi:hypothetical protein CK203_040754 [Vitis vinifera]|uniref:Uncharacterized protein n=1 Tax=Vitis vinifera TaxID=29760 RepID=A0A438HF52_VITVI|nr:hypothetical protein CK203_040754 [Vitis vinifera]